MTTFTTQDKESFIQDVNVQDKFNFRFIKEGNEWVCRMPDWLLKQAQETFYQQPYESDYLKGVRLAAQAGEEG